jgi:hypothetical protein
VDWWLTLATLVVAAFHLVVDGGDERGRIPMAPAGILCGLHSIIVLGLWWLGAGQSPLSRFLPPAVDYYPIITAIAAVGAVLFSRRYSDPEDGHELSWMGDLRTASARRTLATQAGLVSLVAMGLSILGIVRSDHPAVTLAMASTVFLLGVKSLPRVEWLYPAVACLVASSYHLWLSRMTPAGLMAAVMGGAFALWALGVLVQRSRGRVCHWLGLRPLGYEYPLFHSSMAMGLIAAAIRVFLSVNQNVTWNGYPWLPFMLSLLILLMPRAYPRAEWVHGSLALLVYGVAAALSPSLVSLAAVGLAGMSLGLGLRLLEHVIRSHEPAIRDRLGVGDANYLGVVRLWSGGLFLLASTLTIAIVFWGMAASFGIQGALVSGSRPLDWWMSLASLVLASVYLILAGGDPLGWIDIEPAGVLSGLHTIVVLILWWLGVGHSPLIGLLPPAVDYYPIATAIGALSATYLAHRFTVVEASSELTVVGDQHARGSRRVLAFQSCFLAMLAIVFTGGNVSGTAVATGFLASMAMATAALMCGWTPVATLAGIAWAGTWSTLGGWLARRLGLLAADQQATLAAWGALISAYTLRVVSGRLRRGGWISKSWIMPGESSAAPLGVRFAYVLEGVATASGLLASATVLAIGLRSGVSAAWVAFGGLGVLVASAILHLAMAPRWRSEVPVYLAQLLIVGAYVELRLAYPMSVAVDAAVLTLLAYLDMGIAEVVVRLDRGGYYTRPSRYTSLVLPLLPLLQIFRAGNPDQITVFYFAAAATFYATACGRLRWKSLGYAAAVFANAAMWLLWSLIGWKLADYPQLYLVPVGFSAILFAEVNRELGRSAVNAIRSVGLVVIYASLAMPIWQFASFGAWLTLLIASLLGVFIGIGLRLQTFLWLGLATFVLDVVYEMGRVSLDHALAKWAIMGGLGFALLLFVALNEKKRILSQMLEYYANARTWE